MIKLFEEYINEQLNNKWSLSLSKIPGFGTVKTLKKIEEFKSNDITEFGIRYFTESGINFVISSNTKDFKNLKYIYFYLPNGEKIIKTDIQNKDKEIILKVISKVLIESTKKLNSSKLHEGFELFIAPLLVIFSVLLPYLIALGVQSFRNWKESRTYRNDKIKEDESIFSAIDPNKQEFEEYNILNQGITSVITGNRNSLIITGRGGIGKTFAVKKNFYFSKLKQGKDYRIISGMKSADELYGAMYKYRKFKCLVFDDCETIFSDPNTIGILKAACDNYPRRIINFIIKDSKSVQDILNIPPKSFEFTSKIIIISNQDSKTIDPALKTRTTVIDFTIDGNKILDKIETTLSEIMPNINMDIKREVLNYLREQYNKNKKIDINYRTFINAVEHRILFETEWKKIVSTSIQ